MEENAANFTRRRFLGKAAVACAIGAGGLALAAALREIIPPLKKENKRFTIGPLANLPLNTFTLMPKEKIFVFRDHEGVRALSAVCTHLGCVLERGEEGGFLCPCHGSRFDDNGKVVSGPAPSALAFFKVDMAPNGQLLVDMNQQVPSSKIFRIQ
jgi:cytochrome b6-f complex iron-sulfur subunit